MKVIKTLIMIAVGILLAYGGIQWSEQAKSIRLWHGPVIIMEEDLNVTIEIPPIEYIGNFYHYPAIFGVVCGIVWIIFAFSDLSFPAAVWMATGVMLIPVGIINLFQGIWRFISGGSNYAGDDYMRAQYPSAILRFLFMRHTFISLFIFAAAAAVCFGIGMSIEKAVSKYTKKA